MRRSTVVIELADDPRFARDLAAGGVFVPGCALRLAEECDLLVRGASHQLVLPARVVYVEETRGAGLELLAFSTELRAQLAELEPVARPTQAFIDDSLVIESASVDSSHDILGSLDDHGESRGYTGPVPLVRLVALEPLDDDLAVPLASDDAVDTAAYPQIGRDVYAGDADETDAGPDPNADRSTELPDDADLDVVELNFGAPEGDDPVDVGEVPLDDPPLDDAQLAGAQLEPGKTNPPFARNVHERLRGLNLAAQMKLAVSGEQHERIMLERLYGKNVWETLLRNPRLTPPEVARIARYGSLPRVLLEIVVANNAWLQVPEVRRALLSNPRLGTDQIIKVLRLTPKHELKLAAIHTAYPAAVRNTAKMMLRGD